VMQRVLRQATERYQEMEGDRSWLTHVRGLPGAACPRCGTPLARTVAGGRTTYFCPRCQPLADPLP
jgi:formamidopyrimidine-DNA glycosylase